MDTTTIELKRETRDKLAEFKVHPRQSFDEIIRRLISEKEALMKVLDEQHQKRTQTR